MLNVCGHSVFVCVCVCVCVLKEEKDRRSKAAGQQHMAKLTAWKLQGTGVFIHWEVVQFKLALSINGQPAETNFALMQTVEFKSCM